MNSNDLRLLMLGAGSILVVILLVARFKVSAFLALMAAALGLGLVSGMPLEKIASGFQDGVGAVIGSIGMVVALGAVIGKLLGDSGGAAAIAKSVFQLSGEAKLPWAMLFISLLVGLPVFFSVGVVLLAPILYGIARQSSMPFLKIGLPMMAGLSVAHGLVPPHPGPMAAISVLGADTGKTILWSLAFGVPAAVLAGPLFSNLLLRLDRMPAVIIPAEVEVDSKTNSGGSAFSALLVILLPVALMLFATVVDVTLPKTHPASPWFRFIGHPLTALGTATLVGIVLLGVRSGRKLADVMKSVESSLPSTATVLLVVGAGGGYNKILILSGVGEALANLGKTLPVSPLVLGWMVAVLVRVATGSATVAVTTAAGILAPIIGTTGHVNKELMVVVMGAGSLAFSHVNDGGFWFVKEYLKLDVAGTLKTWTVLETIISVAVLLMALLVSLAL